MIIYTKGPNQDKDDKRKREGKEVAHSFYKKKKYLIEYRYYTHAVPMEKQQLQQQQLREKRKWKSQWYYYSYHVHQTKKYFIAADIQY